MINCLYVSNLLINIILVSHSVLQCWQHSTAGPTAYPLKWDYYDTWKISFRWGFFKESCYRKEVWSDSGWGSTILQSECLKCWSEKRLFTLVPSCIIYFNFSKNVENFFISYFEFQIHFEVNLLTFF